MLQGEIGTFAAMSEMGPGADLCKVLLAHYVGGESR